MPPRLSLDGRPGPGPESRRDDDAPKTMFEKIWEAHLVRAADRRHARDPLRRSAPHPRGHVAAGVHLAARARAVRCGAPSARWRRWITRRRRRRAGATASIPVLDNAAALQIAALEKNCAGLRHRAARAGQRAAGDRARHRPGAGADPAGDGHRLRRQPHQHPRRVRRAGVRHRHQRGVARAGDAEPAAEPVQDAGRDGRGASFGPGSRPRTSCWR